jgi:hypothetical protein
VTVVRHAFAAFAGRDLDTVLKLCDSRRRAAPPHTSTAELTGRQDPYSGHDGMRAHTRDISQVWKSLELTPTAFRAADHSVIVFGPAGLQIRDQHGLGTLGLTATRRLITSIEVFQPRTKSVEAGIPDISAERSQGTCTEQSAATPAGTGREPAADAHITRHLFVDNAMLVRVGRRR